MTRQDVASVTPTHSPDSLVRTLLRRIASVLRGSNLARAAYRRGPMVVRRWVLFYRYHGYPPRLVRPRTHNEKVNWRICFDRRELLSWTCDKLRMKEEARRRDPDIAIPRTLWRGTDVSELAAVPLPDRWVLKPNHSTQVVHLGTGRPSVAELERITEGWLAPSRAESRYEEWAYGQAERCLLVEEWIGDDDGAPPPDLKFLCYGGEVAVIQIHLDRYSSHTVGYYDPSWRLLPVGTFKTPTAREVPAPENLATLLQHATLLSAGFDFIRIDLYNTDRGVYFGEFTPYPASAMVRFDPASFDRELGNRWKLPRLRGA